MARPPLVLIPGIQGRWEYLQPTIDALASDFDVITFSLCGERECASKNAGDDFDVHARLVLDALQNRGIDRATICGISFGGLVALHFAATHPDRTDALVLVSTPGPGWRLRRRHEIYAKLPWLFGALFLAESPLRLRREIAVALPRLRDRARYVWWQLRTLLSAPLSLRRMAARARLIPRLDVKADCLRVTAPTLVITGEPRLDRVVEVERTREYLRLIPPSTGAVIEETGHLGSLTRPHEFARVIRDFVRTHASSGGARRSA